jgi:hypothetical protein
MAGIGKYKKGAKFTLKSGNTPPFKMMGSKTPLYHIGKHPSEKDGHTTDAHKGMGLSEAIFGKKFKDTRFGKELQRIGTELGSTVENIRSNIKGGRPIFGSESGQLPVTTKDKEKIDIIETAEEETQTTPSHKITDKQKSATTLYDFYTAEGGELPSVGDRKALYEAHGGEGNYGGTRAQNIYLLKQLQGGEDSPTKHLGEATHPTKSIPAHEGHMSKKLTKKKPKKFKKWKKSPGAKKAEKKD